MSVSYTHLDVYKRQDQYFIPVNGEGLGIAHRRKKNAPAVCLFIDLFDRTALPVGVFPERTAVSYTHLM